MNALQSAPALTWLLSYLFNALWQIPLVFPAAWLVARMLRRAGPRIEHRVWVTALLLQIVLPACNLRIAALWHALVGLFQSTGATNAGAIRIAFGPATAAGSTLQLPFAFEAGILVAWICCVFYFAGRLAWGLAQTRTLARAAMPITLTADTALRWSRYCRRLGITTPPPAIAASPHGIGPVTVGLSRGVVLIPPGFLESIPAADLDAVLAHELAHVARRDFLKNLVYGLVSLPIAWHPLAGRARARLGETRELVCDVAAVDAIAADVVVGRKQYAQSLLRIAALLAGRGPVATLHALGIFNFNADSNTLERRVMTLTRKPAPLSTTRRILIAAACSVLAFATCASALALRTDVRALSSAAETANPAKIQVKPGIMAGQRISGDNPVYPNEARAKRIQGTVVLDATIGKDGTVENLQVVKSPAESLSKSALDAVRTWRYRPYLLNGDPVEVETNVNVTFNLEG
jgi:TonB family protein